MIKYENECCSCATENYPCVGDSCPNRRVPHYYCDNCGTETTLYHYDGFQYCIDCIEEDLEIVEGGNE